jgi:hypothetical protein
MQLSLQKSWSIPVALFCIAALVYALFGFNGKLVRDDAIWLYSGQQMAQGIPPYVSIFDFKSPLGPMLAGIGAWAAYLVGGDDVLFVRVIFFLLSCLAVVAVYYWSRTLFRSRSAGVLAAVAFLGFWGFARHAGSGPQAKTAMVLFQVLALYYASEKKWFWSGFTGALAAWAWQPAAIFVVIPFLLAVLQSDRKSCWRLLLGAVVPSLAILAYFVYHGGLWDLLDGAVLFIFNEMQRGKPFLEHVRYVRRTLLEGFPYAFVPICLGFLFLIGSYPWRRRGRTWRRMLADDPFAGLWLTLPLPVLWSLRDFQGYDDFFIFLPYVAIGFGGLLFYLARRLCARRSGWYALLVGLFIAAMLVPSALFYNAKRAEIGRYLDLQKGWAQTIEKELVQGGTLMSIGTPELMVLSHRRNTHRFLYIVEGIDSFIQDNTPGGFEAWLADIDKAAPRVIGFKYSPGKYMDRLREWLAAHYQETRVGDWTLFVRPQDAQVGLQHGER